ncbi:hypothetical protein CDV31_013451 [Fusarium ambrosium]|uniref:Uncharacterized protein n=1 Tax=Fusarium ambrosium TaxID=131363 RepID=A0A428T3F9_9HYPO|nr:hypothetical protein CDV31_013451 [Fusarium ambrosium]
MADTRVTDENPSLFDPVLIPEKSSPQTKEQPAEEQPNEELNKGPAKRTSVIRVWSILFLHAVCCIALALSIALALDGYLAGDEKSSRVNDGKLLLKVSDVTTLVSVSLVVIKIIAGSWSAIVLWACGRYMLSKSNDNKTQTAVSSMIQWKVPPGVRSLGMIPRSFNSWNISILTLVIMVQAFTAPILTGSVNWNVGFSVSQTAVSVASIASKTGYNNWYWYNAQGSFDKRGPLRTAAGYANLEWADPSTVDSHGKSITGNGCRHLFGNDGLPPDSILTDAVLPCINIHDIHWIRSKDELTGADWDEVDGDDLTLVDDTPLSYYHEGVAMVFNSTDLRQGPNTTDSPPPPYLFSGTRIVTLMLGRYNVTDPPCSGLKNTIFGDVNALGYHRVRSRVNSVHENCYIIGRVNFTAGVTTSRRATYLTPRVVEDQTPINDVDFKPNSWVHEAIWLLPDLMTMLSVMNASQLPTYGNVDGHVGELLRQGYLAAWGMLAHGYGQETETYKALPAEGRLVADVSFARVFAWLALCMLMTGWGALTLGTTLGRRDLQPPQDVMEGQTEERSEQARGVGHTLLEWCCNRD